jgi:hypothetical protein
MIDTKKEEINLKKVKEVHQELYNPDNPSFFKEDIPYYIVIGIKGKSFEDDLAIPVTRDNIEKFTLNQFLELYIYNKNEDTFLETLNIGNIVEVDTILRQKLKKTFNELKDLLVEKQFEIFSEPIELGPDWQKKGQPILEKKVNLDDSILKYLMYISINAPEESYINVRQYTVHFKFESIIAKTEIIIQKEKISKEFKPIETQFNYQPDKYKLMKIPAVKRRIEERQKWLSYSGPDYLFYLIFAPIRFLRFKHMQNRLTRNYIEGGKAKPSIVNDIKENALLGGVWEYKDIEYLTQIDMFVDNGIIVPTDFNYYSPPYSTIYKAIKDGVLIVGGIEHHFEGPKEEEIIRDGIKEKIRKPGHFITYTCMKKMGSEGTQVLIKYQNEIGTTNKMLTCKEMDMEMVGEKMETMDKNKDKENEKRDKMEKM